MPKKTDVFVEYAAVHVRDLERLLQEREGSDMRRMCVNNAPYVRTILVYPRMESIGWIPEFDSSKPLRSHKQSPGSYESITCKRSEGRFQISL
jgi:hypothetical protein